MLSAKPSVLSKAPTEPWPSYLPLHPWILGLCTLGKLLVLAAFPKPFYHLAFLLLFSCSPWSLSVSLCIFCTEPLPSCCYYSPPVFLVPVFVLFVFTWNSGGRLVSAFFLQSCCFLGCCIVNARNSGMEWFPFVLKYPGCLNFPPEDMRLLKYKKEGPDISSKWQALGMVGGCCSEWLLAASALLTNVDLWLGLRFGLSCTWGSFYLRLAFIQFSHKLQSSLSRSPVNQWNLMTLVRHLDSGVWNGVSVIFEYASADID